MISPSATRARLQHMHELGMCVTAYVSLQKFVYTHTHNGFYLVENGLSFPTAFDGWPIPARLQIREDVRTIGTKTDQ